MKKKKLTINALAGSNLRKRKKQYAIMIIGIILAMVFSSSVIISMFSLKESRYEIGRNGIGVQDEIILNVSENSMEQAKKDGYVDEFGYAYMLGYASTDAKDKDNGFYIAWLDDNAKKLSYQSFIEGAYPTKENEIAVENSALIRLGIEAKIGDEISLEVFPQNGISHIDHSNQKKYKLVGIVADKASNIDRTIKTDTMNEKRVPAAFVCAGTETDAGGKESLAAYVTLADFDYPKYIKIDDEYTVPNNKNTVFQQEYLNEKYNASNDEFYMIETEYMRYAYGYNHLENSVHYMGVIGIVLALTSCVAIVNSFNSNIKERKQQIGMLRAVGTTKKQIVRILGREAVIISLISVPVSLGISYLLVLALSLFYGEDFVLTIDAVSVIVCGAVGFITVMLAALIPIIHATRITPMQAIRNVEVARKMKIKNLKTQKSFSVPKLLAKRSMAFHKGNQIAVSVLLVSTILFSCFGFSLISYEKTHLYKSGYDYYIGGAFIDGAISEQGIITDNDKQNICAVPYVTGYGVKNCDINVMIDEFTDYFKIVSGESVYVSYTGFDEYGVTAENYAELNKTEFSEYYSDIKSQAGYNRDYIPTTLTAIDDWKLETLESYLVSGKINLDKLASGEEVILIAPQKAAVGLIEYYTQQEIVLLDEKIEDGFEPAFYGEFEYKAGDMIDLSMIHYDDEETIYAENETIYNIDRVDKKAKIGAVISPNAFETKENRGILQYDSNYLSVLTSIAGMNQFSNNLNYECIYMYANGEITDEIDDAVTSAINPMLYKYNTEVDSIYQYEKRSNESNNSDLVAMLALMIIGFAICASLTNNAFTASIRERKRELGTLRAVGISRKEFVESYVRQLLKTFTLGYGLGFGIYVLIYVVYSVVVYFINQTDRHYLHETEVEISFNPWITVVFCIVLFAICSINLWIKIRKEMKNSIIDNIREL